MLFNVKTPNAVVNLSSIPLNDCPFLPLREEVKYKSVAFQFCKIGMLQGYSAIAIGKCESDALHGRSVFIIQIDK